MALRRKFSFPALMGVIALSLALAACQGATEALDSAAFVDLNPALSKRVRERLTNRIFVGEWKTGYSYKIDFGSGSRILPAVVQVVDDDGRSSNLIRPVTATISGSNMVLDYAKSNRRDYLIYTPSTDALSGYSLTQDRPGSSQLFALGEVAAKAVEARLVGKTLDNQNGTSTKFLEGRQYETVTFTGSVSGKGQYYVRNNRFCLRKSGSSDKCRWVSKSGEKYWLRSSTGFFRELMLK